MRILICGAGQVGYGIAERLSREANDVTVIDSSPELIENIQDKLDVRGYVDTVLIQTPLMLQAPNKRT